MLIAVFIIILFFGHMFTDTAKIPFVNLLSLLFQGIAGAVEAESKMIEEYYGPGRALTLVQACVLHNRINLNIYIALCFRHRLPRLIVHICIYYY